MESQSTVIEEYDFMKQMERSVGKAQRSFPETFLERCGRTGHPDLVRLKRNVIEINGSIKGRFFGCIQTS